MSSAAALETVHRHSLDTDAVRLERFAWMLRIAWTGVVCCSLAWGLCALRAAAYEGARIQARSLFQKDLLYRRWNAGHGGVYAPISETVRPNPHLTAPERDVQTPSGRGLTLINPAYMTRQVHELGAATAGVQGHITSLNPIRPENAADAWETTALAAFEQGEAEVSKRAPIDGVVHMRLMRPLPTEQGCLKCHEAQGYRVGDIRGGISTSVPLAPFLAIARRHGAVAAATHLALWLAGLWGIGIGVRRLARAIATQKRLAADQREMATFVARKHRFEALGALAGGVGHEINNPLNGVMSYAQLIVDDPGATEEMHDYAGEILTESRRIVSVVRALSSFAERERHYPADSDTDMRTVVEDAVALCQTALKKRRIRIEADIQDGLGPVRCSGHRVQQAVVNLILNAADALDEKDAKDDSGKVIRILVRELTDRDGAWLRTTVADRGTGIAADIQEHVFDPFFTTKGRTRASGLGLTIARRTAEEHGGRVHLETEPGAGTEFHLDLPLSS